MLENSNFHKFLDEIILEVEKELEEETTTGDAAGYDTPNAFGAGRDKDKKKTKKTATQAGYEVVNEQYVFIKVKNKKIAIGVSDLDDLIRGQDVVGINVKYPGQQEWIHPKIDKWKLVREAKKPQPRKNRWLALKNDESMHTNKKLAVGLKELKYQLREVEKFLGWYGKLKNINELDSDTYWKRTNTNIRNIKERIINIARKLQEIEK